MHLSQQFGVQMNKNMTQTVLHKLHISSSKIKHIDTEQEIQKHNKHQHTIIIIIHKKQWFGKKYTSYCNTIKLKPVKDNDSAKKTDERPLTGIIYPALASLALHTIAICPSHSAYGCTAFVLPAFLCTFWSVLECVFSSWAFWGIWERACEHDIMIQQICSLLSQISKREQLWTHSSF